MSASDRPQEVADIVDELGDTPTANEVYQATDHYDVDYIAAAAYAQAKAGGGGGGSVPTGAGTPVGSVTPSGKGALYVDTTNGTLYIATGTTDTDWVSVGGNSRHGEQGLHSQAGGALLLKATSGAQSILTDEFVDSGNGNGVYWQVNDADGAQTLTVFLGSEGQFSHTFAADGSYLNANGIIFPTSDPGVAGAWWDNAGTLTKDGGGGGSPVTQTFTGSNATVAADTSTSLAWAAGDGTANLLDLSTPTAPIANEAGTYAITATVLQATNAATPAVWRAILTADTTVTGAANTIAGAKATTILDDTDTLSSLITLQLTTVMPAGGELNVKVLHEDSGAVDFVVDGVLVVKLP